MPINTSNVGGLQISQGSEGIDFTTLTNDIITAKITDDVTTNGGYSLHGWIEVSPKAKEEHALVTGSALAKGTSTSGPVVTLAGAALAKDALVHIRKRGLHATYKEIWEVVGSSGSSSSGGVKSVQCVGNLLVVTY